MKFLASRQKLIRISASVTALAVFTLTPDSWFLAVDHLPAEIAGCANDASGYYDERKVDGVRRIQLLTQNER